MKTSIRHLFTFALLSLFAFVPGIAGANAPKHGCFCKPASEAVCGVDGKTYANPCKAGCAKVKIAYHGRCKRRACPKGTVSITDTSIRCIQAPCDQTRCLRLPKKPTCPKGATLVLKRRSPLCNKTSCFSYKCVKSKGKAKLQPKRRRCPKGFRPIIDHTLRCVGCDKRRCVPIRKRRKPRRCLCPTIYKPVCDVNGHTYSNRCKARCDGVRIAHPGKCRPPRKPFRCPKGYRPQRNSRVRCFRPPCPQMSCVPITKRRRCICPAVYKPVRGTDGKIYSNSCRARCAGVGIASRGIKRPRPRRPRRRRCICPDVYLPVCGTNGRTYSNKCGARCAGVKVRYSGKCKSIK